MNETNKKLLLVVVLYNQRLHETATYASLIAGSGEDVFVYDNSPVPQHADTIDFAPGWKYVSDTANGGISKAYNQAACYAREKGYEWMLFLDQDTVFPENILYEYKEIIRRYPHIKLIAPPMKMDEARYMSPVKVRFHMAKPARSVPQGKVSLYTYSPINSGLAVEVDAFYQAGGYNESVKLDFSDYQFVERIRKLYPDLYVLSKECLQSFSDVTESNGSKLARFGLFCNSLKHCERQDRLDSFWYFLLVMKRTISLAYRTHSLKPFGIVLTNYF